MKFMMGAAAPLAVLSVALLGISNFARAEGSGNSSSSGSSDTSSSGYGSEQSGTVGQDPSSSSGSMVQEDITTTSRSQGGMGDKDMKNEAAKMLLAPHAIAVETSLMSALDQVKGLRAQVKTAQNQPNSEFMMQYKRHSREIKDALNQARKHESELKSRANKFPNVAQSDEYRQLSPAINDAERLSQQWEKQSASSSYWRDNNKVSQDLDQLEKRLNNALDKTKSFSSRIDVASVG
jgi:hypothetical protein